MAIARDIDSSPDTNMVNATRKQVLRAALSYFITRLLLLVGLCVICVIGTLTFQALEMPNELSTCEANANLYFPMEDQSAQKLWNIGQSYFQNMGDADQQATIDSMAQVVEDFASNVQALGNFDGRNCSLMGTADGVEYRWNTFGAVLFATTIFTTVGYGNVAPSTSWGKICCFAYGMVSIPYMLWCLSVLGELMAAVFQFVYVNVCCLGFCARRARRRLRERQTAEKKRCLREAMISNKLGTTGIPASWKELYDSREEEMNRINGIMTDRFEDDDEDDDDDDDVAIPLTVTLCVIFGYIMLGAVMFGMWENWDAMAAAYFCFITISTIGFGDIVPGAAAKGVKATTDALKMMVDAVYIVVGMAIISMAFNLIQENMAKKARAIEQKLSQARANEENSVDGDDDPVTARAVMPAMTAAPSIRAPAGLAMPGGGPMPFIMPQLGEGWADRMINKPMVMHTPATPLPGQQQQQAPPATPGPGGEGGSPPTRPPRSAARSRGPGSAASTTKKPDEEETSFNDKKNDADGHVQDIRPEPESGAVDGGD